MQKTVIAGSAKCPTTVRIGTNTHAYMYVRSSAKRPCDESARDPGVFQAVLRLVRQIRGSQMIA